MRAVETDGDFRKTVSGRPVRVIGSGYESTVYTDGNNVYKVFNRDSGPYMRLGEQLRGRFAGCRHIPDIDCFLEDGRAVFTYPFRESLPYRGGMEEQMVGLMREAMGRGVCFKDVKPANLRVCGGDLMMVDIGWDVVPFCMRDFLFMVQRAFLSMRFADRSDFKAMARRALTDWDMPELTGFRDFFNRVYEGVVLPGPADGVGQLVIPNDVWIDGVFSEVAERQVVCAPSCEELKGIRRRMDPGERVVIIVGNPFFGGADDVENLLCKSGFVILSHEDSPARPEGNVFVSDLTAYCCEATEPLDRPVSLLIKTCYQDAPMLERCVKHIVSQLERPDPFDERVVVVDCKRAGFLRQYADADECRVIDILDGLAGSGVIDRYILYPGDPETAEDINRRWFGIGSAGTHSIRNIPIASQLFGFESCRNSRILQCDCDVIVVRMDPAHRYLKDMMDALDSDPDAISVGFNIAHAPDSEPNVYNHPGDGGFVPEVRICLLDRDRLESIRPFSNSVVDGVPELSWYRSVERTQSLRGKHSLRGGDPRTFYIHPQNTVKGDIGFWNRVLDCAERGRVPRAQFESVDLVEDRDAWNERVRDGFVFVICGRNLTNSLFLRCWQSVVSQSRSDWGAVIVDDGSDDGLHDCIRHVAGSRDNVVIVHNRERKGALRNVYESIRDHMIDGNQVVVILDMDDMLISRDTLSRLRRLYLDGHDMVVGNALKSTSGIMVFVPDFKDTRNRRMGDVWIHLRSFRKYLFDSVDPGEFVDGEGRFVDHFTELTYTVPIAEMSTDPFFQSWPVYYWEPRIARNEAHYRSVEETKELVRSRPRHGPEDVPSEGVRPVPAGMYGRLVTGGTITVIRHGEKESGVRDADLTETGYAESVRVGSGIAVHVDAAFASPSPRTVRTAEGILEGNRSEAAVVTLESLKGAVITDKAEWERIVRTRGRAEAFSDWLDGRIPESVREPPEDAAYRILMDLWDRIGSKAGSAVIAVTHDHVVKLLAHVMGCGHPEKVRYLDGYTFSSEDVYVRMMALRTRLIDKSSDYTTSTDLVEWDITTRCNLNCLNCDRLCGHRADADFDISDVDGMLKGFESIGVRRIRIMGGEPVHHPRFVQLMTAISEWAESHPDVEIVVYTNGVSPPAGGFGGIGVRNTGKTSRVNRGFDPIMVAPADIGVEADFSKGCWITRDCGMGVGPDGLVYPCAAGAAIAIARGLGIGMEIEDISEEGFRAQREVLCRLCGHFLSRNYPDREGMPSPDDLEPRTGSWSGHSSEEGSQ